jgi:hypothetical protein
MKYGTPAVRRKEPLLSICAHSHDRIIASELYASALLWKSYYKMKKHSHCEGFDLHEKFQHILSPDSQYASNPRPPLISIRRSNSTMKLSIALLSNVLFAITIAGSPLSSGLDRLILEPRAGKPIGSHPNIKVIPENIEGTLDTATPTDHFVNWAGAVLTAPPSGQTFNAVTGTFVVPEPSPPTSGAGTWSVSAWVGIDGDSYQGAMLQAGVSWEVDVDSNGDYSYQYYAWFERYPNGELLIGEGDFNVTVGDSIQVIVESTSDSSGCVQFSNTAIGGRLYADLTAPSSTAVLEDQSVEYIVEDDGDFANFGLSLSRTLRLGRIRVVEQSIYLQLPIRLRTFFWL